MAIKVTVSLDDLLKEVQGVKRVYRSHTIALESNPETAAIELLIESYNGEDVKRQNLVEFDSNDRGDMALWNGIWDAYLLEFNKIGRA